MAYCKVSGKKIYYDQSITANPNDSVILLIHGAGGTSEVWLNQLSQIKDYPLLALDLPGHGNSEGYPANTIAEYSQFIDEFVRTLELKSVILAGHSMGGGVVLECVLANPEWLKGIILVDTGSRLRVKKEMLEQLAKRILPFDIIPYLYCQNCSPEVLDKAKENMKSIIPQVYFADFQACDAFDRSKEIQNINLEAYILCGEEDRMTPLKYSQALHEALPKSELKIIPQAGHMSMQENPAEVNKVIVEFLKRF
ncbi:alpha/beta fold hydrolase [Desulfitobacterium sp. Sab5]|uniref:alpha/beta fold hydrolase n=1 Tax=Desulfitobacterium nosdiversum TaxID=3375356 RepID=UPI003CE991FF